MTGVDIVHKKKIEKLNFSLKPTNASVDNTAKEVVEDVGETLGVQHAVQGANENGVLKIKYPITYHKNQTETLLYLVRKLFAYH